MPIVISALVVIGLFIWWNWGRNRARAELSNRLDPLANRVFRRRKCRWSPVGGSGALKEFRCETCGVTAYSQSARGPAECKKGLRGGL
ncbi:hypothetical protein KUV47_18920 [Vannielia litorea]|uniref:hypothetical protein n=1 Tax=Vannielia TaxID=2813041 RepID=UPI001C967FDD|nr:hypothetical protein [Vannielia litorea]MBY6050053.1 hypothetical protein [Vannielia litorea]MBY6077467.1 hypothetical protein [Vannielia litorea]MBY6155303.1 hypothetical protein [Vannielia litorea]